MMQEFTSWKWNRSSLGDWIKRIDGTGEIDRQRGCGWPRSARTAANIHWTGKLAAKQSWSKSCVLICLGWGGGCNRMVYRHTTSDTDQLKRVLTDCWAQLSQDTLNWAIDQLLKTDDSYQGKGCAECWISSRLTVCANDHCYTVC